MQDKITKIFEKSYSNKNDFIDVWTSLVDALCATKHKTFELLLLNRYGFQFLQLGMTDSVYNNNLTTDSAVASVYCFGSIMLHSGRKKLD